MKSELKLVQMSSVEPEKVEWLWNPYIPLGKTTIIHGDPGEGKTHAALALIATLTRGDPLPMSDRSMSPVNVIYQTAEDGVADTIRPRLDACEADCSRVFFIDDGDSCLTVSDKRIEQAVRETSARLVVLDPLQAFLGSKVDMNRANEVRPLMKKLGDMAQRTGCAVILISHMNKGQGKKSGYRGLGSIDFRAAARSVLLVGRVSEESDLRAIVHDKSSLAKEGRSISFTVDENNKFHWKGYCDITPNELLDGSGLPMTKVETMEDELVRLLIQPLPASYIYAYAKNIGVGERTVKAAKEHVGVISEKRGGQWYWRLPDAPSRDESA